MLILSRTEGQSILLRTTDGDVWVTLLSRERTGWAIGITAPDSVEVIREELIDGWQGRMLHSPPSPDPEAPQ